MKLITTAALVLCSLVIGCALTPEEQARRDHEHLLRVQEEAARAARDAAAAAQAQAAYQAQLTAYQAQQEKALAEWRKTPHWVYPQPAPCDAVEVLPAGVQPTRPFRVIGPVEANWNVTAGGRYHTLQQHACKMGADAVIGATNEEHYRGGAVYGTVVGDQVWINSGGGSYTTASGMAITYTDKRPLLYYGDILAQPQPPYPSAGQPYPPQPYPASPSTTSPAKPPRR
jgi:hypothetical protein